MNKLDAITSQQVLAFPGKWRGESFAACIIDLQEAIADGSDQSLCNELLCLASRLADKNGRVEVKAYLRQMTTKGLIKSRYENFISHSQNMDKEERNAIYVRLGNRLFQHYIKPGQRIPYGTIRTQLVNRTSKVIKRKTKKQREAEEAALKAAKEAEDEEAENSSSDAEDSSAGTDQEGSDAESAEGSDEEEEDPEKFTAERRNILCCLLMRFVHDTPNRATAVGKLVAELAVEKILEPATVQYALHLNIPELTKKMMNHLIRASEQLATPAFLTAVENGFETVRGDRLEKLTLLAQRDDLPDEGCALVGKILATTGMLVDDKRRPFSQIEIRALLGDVEAESRRGKILSGYKAEMTELSKLAMKSGTTPDASDNEGD